MGLGAAFALELFVMLAIGKIIDTTAKRDIFANQERCPRTQSARLPTLPKNIWKHYKIRVGISSGSMGDYREFNF